jgi:protocatechuate 3,4-dioxygenase, beta subunit
MNIWRRKLNQLLFTLPALISPLLLKAQSSSVLLSNRLPTPQDGEGPFYPKQWTGELDGNLLNFNGRPMTLAGKVYSVDGTPLAGATVEVWQCDEIGEYRHPSSGGEAPAERGFQGFARILSTTDGSYSFITLKPVPYNGRPAHVHFRVVAAGHRDLTTQMYFRGESEEGNFLLKLYGFLGGFSRQRDRLTASPETRQIEGKTELLTAFDITLEKNT